MYIRYQHVRNAGFVLLGLTILGGCGLCLFSPFIAQSPDRAGQPTSRVEPVQSTQVSVSSDSSSAGTWPAVLDALNAPASPNAKAKDALGKGSRWKVNAYEESGDSHYDRAKVDFHRDNTWDESLTWKQGRWERESDKLVWNGSSWSRSADARSRDKTGSTARRADTSSPAEDKLVPIARRMLDERASGDKAKDVTGGDPKINLYDDDKNGTWDRAKIDYGRDGSDEEKWTVKGGRVERKIEKTGEVYLLEGSRWVKK